MRELYQEKEKLFYKSIGLRNYSMQINSDKQRQRVRKQQDEMYKKFKFYEEFIKAKEKVDEKEKDICTIQR